MERGRVGFLELSTTLATAALFLKSNQAQPQNSVPQRLAIVRLKLAPILSVLLFQSDKTTQKCLRVEFPSPRCYQRRPNPGGTEMRNVNALPSRFVQGTGKALQSYFVNVVHCTYSVICHAPLNCATIICERMHLTGLCLFLVSSLSSSSSV